MTKTLSRAQPVDGDAVQAALTAVYNWNYSSEVEELRTLYAKSLDLQWIAMRDLPWEGDIDHDAFSGSFSLGPLPIQETRFWQDELDADTRWKISSGMASFLLSNFLHGEQGALMVASQLVNAVPHMDAKFYAASQTMDEARHVEAFAAYIAKLGGVRPIAPGVKQLLDRVVATDRWEFKFVGMQVVTEGLALYVFRDMRNATREPLLRKLLTLVARDEARHTAYGIQYLTRIVPTLDDRERAELEDFAFEAARVLIDSRGGASLRDSAMQVMAEAGVDLQTALPKILAEQETMMQAMARDAVRPGPVRGFVIPTLRTIGLMSDRIEAHFDAMFAALPGTVFGPIKNDARELPADLAAWVEDPDEGTGRR
jgi:hypothetical protein